MPLLRKKINSINFWWINQVMMPFIIFLGMEASGQEWMVSQVNDISKKIYPFYKEGIVDGYYFVYKNLGENARYELQILDADLQTRGSLALLTDRDLIITAGEINGDKLLLELSYFEKGSWSDLFINVPSRTVQHLLIDRTANILYNDSLQLKTISDLKRSGLTAANPFHISHVFSIDKTGAAFILPTTRKDKTFEFTVRFFQPNASAASWEYTSPKNVSDRNPVFFAGDSFMIWSFFERTYRNKKEPSLFLRAHNASTGESLFEKPLLLDGKTVVPCTASIIGEQLKIVGQYTNGRYVHDMQNSSGLCTITVNKQGTFTDSATLTWKELQRNEVFPKKGKFLIRDIVGLPGNHYVLILEHSREVVSGGALLFNALVAATNASLGTNNQAIDIFDTVYDDLILVECSEGLSVLHTEIVPQPQNSGAQFLQANSGKSDSSLNISFIDRSTNPNTNGQIRHTRLQYACQSVKMENTLLETHLSNAKFYPAKNGYVLKAFYDTKEKTQKLILVPVKDKPGI